VLHELNRLEEAEQTFDRARQLAPQDVEVLAHLGAIQCKRARYADAESSLRAALRLAPGDPGLWIWLARAQQQSGRREQAADAYRRALALDARSDEAVDELGGIYLEEGKLDEAIEHYGNALRSLPGVARVHNGFGCALLLRGRVDEALAQLRRAVELQPDLAGAQHNLGNAYSLRGDHLQAIGAFEAALALRPDDAAVREGLLFEMQNVCDWMRFDELCALQRASAVDPAQRVSPFSLLSIPSSPAEQLQCARNFGLRQEAQVAEARERLAFRFAPGPRERLRIGYLSADFHDHVTPYVMVEMFELHDRSRVEIVAYSYGPDDGSAMRARLLRAFDRFTDIGGLSDTQAAAAVHADSVDILVDLKGYTQHARTGITALRPAPVQVSYMGYAGTMAARFIDYFVADRFVVPPQQAAHYGEKLVYMPATYYVNDRKRPRAAMPRRSELGLPGDAFVFCCFNQTYKILPDVFVCWMRLLGAVPGSVLWLLETNRWAQENLRRQAHARGIDPARLVFAPRISPELHLARIAAADLFLDTRPYNAHTTATDALWVGVPVLTWPGETFPSRVAGSLLTALAMPELIVDSGDAYEALALDLARDPSRLRALRAKLDAMRSSTALFDTAAFTRNLETAYERMWQQYLAGRPLQAIEL
jgi:protein O-GlcNAc transferase